MAANRVPMSRIVPEGDRGSVRWQLLGLLLLVALSGFVTSGSFLAKGTLYWDNLRWYSFFHAQLDSLNRFQEPAWWFPQNQYGFPGYVFAAMLNAAAPTFVLLGTLFWVLGKVGIHVTTIQPVYVLYFGGLIPLLLVVGVWCVARQIFRSSVVIVFVSIVAAFSPGVLLNMTDVAVVEPTVYSLYFTAAYLRFLREQGPVSFLLLVLTACLLALSFSFSWFVWNAVFLPILLACSAIPRGGYRRVRRAIGWVPKWKWVVAGVLVVVCALPNVLIAAQIPDVTRFGLAKPTYASIAGGNPLEILSASVPGIGFRWERRTAESPLPEFLPQAVAKFVSYGYLGLLALPLFLIGLLYGRPGLRLRLLVMCVVLFGMVLLAVYSPLVSAFLLLSAPLRIGSHLSDSLYRAGGFLIVLLGMGLGLEAILRGSARLRWIAAAGALVSSTASLGLYGMLDSWARLGTLAGFISLMGIFYAVVFALSAQDPARNRQRVLWMLLLALTLTDVSTVSFWHVRKLVFPLERTNYDVLNDDGVGLKHPNPNGYANAILQFRSLRMMKDEGLPIAAAGPYALYGAAHPSGKVTSADFTTALASDQTRRSLAVSEHAARLASFRPFLEERRAGRGVSGSVEVAERSYNSLRVSVQSSAPAILFIRDSYSPYWRASVNGADAPIAEALGHFKAVVVPAGRSEVALRFAPSGVTAALWGAYGALLGVGAWLVVSAIRIRKR